jgi:hypothetical protein
MRNLIVLALTAGSLIVAAPRSFAQSAPASQPTVLLELGFQHEKAFEDKHFSGWTTSLVVPTRALVSPVVAIAGVYRSSVGSSRDDKERLLSGAAGIRLQRWRSGVRPWAQVLVGVSNRSQTVTLTSAVGSTTGTFRGTGLFADIGGGISADIAGSLGLFATAGYTSRIEGYVFSGYRLSAGTTVSLGNR